MDGYDFPPFRPPNEAGSILLRITHGCPWNRCAFCHMYRGEIYRHRTVEEVRKDIGRAARIFGTGRKTAFLGDSNPVVVKELPEMLRYLRYRFPGLERVTAYARAKSLQRLGVGRLEELARSGLTRVHIGLESGDAETLKLMNKGAAPWDMIGGALAAKEAGIEVSEYVLLGSGGDRRWEEHAMHTAEVLSSIGPDFIRFRTLTPLPGTPIRKMIDEGSFRLPDPLVRLRETLRIMEGLDCRGTVVASDHVTNNVWLDGRPVYRGVSGTLPDDREKMIAKLRETIDRLRNRREGLIDSTRLFEMGCPVGL